MTMLVISNGNYDTESSVFACCWLGPFASA